jgi:membrane carboxypeptidase/penicillin-binding protein PbpC
MSHEMILTLTDFSAAGAARVTFSSKRALSMTISPGSATLDVGQSQLFTSTVTDGASPYSYQWYLNGAPVSDATKPTWNFKPTAAGSYTVYVRVNDSLDMNATSNVANVIVNPRLSVSISPSSINMKVGQSELFSSKVSGGTSPYFYQWYLNGTLVSGAKSLTWTFTPKSSGSYDICVKATDSLGAQATSDTAVAYVKSK